MKNIFLFIILGLITIGCEEAHTIMSSAGGSGGCEYDLDCEEVDEWWICAETYEDEPWAVSSSEEICLEDCEGECIILEE
jgi:hypothetical protein